MSRIRIIYKPDGGKLAEYRDGECVYLDESYQAANNAPAVMGDIQPYQSMADGTWITSRSHHRAHLKQHGLVEVGNEIAAAMRKPEPKHDNTLRRTIVDVYKAMKA
jgi:hypothetical protein